MVYEEILETFSVDKKRVYIVGFSNGGGMTSRCTIELGDIFSAAVASSGVEFGGFIIPPVRKMPWRSLKNQVPLFVLR